MISEEEYWKYEKDMYILNTGENITLEEIKKKPLQDLTFDLKLINRFQQQLAEITESDLRQCKKCKSKKIIVTERQTRSTDEATTIICQCSNCSHSWKE